MYSIHHQISNRTDMMAKFTYLLILLAYFFGLSSCTDCPDRWVAFQGSCYKFPYNKPMTFYEAENYCRQHHDSHLLQIETALENAFVKDILTGHKAEQHWLGMTDEDVEGVWKWYNTKTPLNFTDWHPSQPGRDGEEDCGILWISFGYQWGDVPCTSHFEPICELKSDEQEVIVG